MEHVCLCKYIYIYLYLHIHMYMYVYIPGTCDCPLLLALTPPKQDLFQSRVISVTGFYNI